MIYVLLLLQFATINENIYFDSVQIPFERPVIKEDLTTDYPYSTIIKKNAEFYNVPINLIRSLIEVESHGNPNAHNKKSDCNGLMGILHGSINPANNIRAGCSILSDRFRRYGTWEKAIRSYRGCNDKEYIKRIIQIWRKYDINMN
jgi:soluble lytic murein transglycosylase-like protein